MEQDQQIAQSPNATETLQKVDEANGREAAELGELLMRNRRDMQMANGGGGGAASTMNSLPRNLIRLFSTFVLVGCKSASAHPQKAAFMTLALMAIVYVAISAPRNGVVISGGRGVFSSGHSTVLLPPTEYLSKYLTSDKFRNLKSSMPELNSGKLADIFLVDDDDTIDGVHIASLSKPQK